jgi:hypothetical protein
MSKGFCPLADGPAAGRAGRRARNVGVPSGEGGDGAGACALRAGSAMADGSAAGENGACGRNSGLCTTTGGSAGGFPATGSASRCTICGDGAISTFAAGYSGIGGGSTAERTEARGCSFWTSSVAGGWAVSIFGGSATTTLSLAFAGTSGVTCAGTGSLAAGGLSFAGTVGGELWGGSLASFSSASSFV